MKITYNANLDDVNPNTTQSRGQVDSNENFIFYDPSVITSCAQIASNPTAAKVTTLPSLFNQSYWTVTDQSGCNTGTSWFTATSAVLLQNGPFVAPASLYTCTGGSSGTATFPENQAATLICRRRSETSCRRRSIVGCSRLYEYGPSAA